MLLVVVEFTFIVPWEFKVLQYCLGLQVLCIYEVLEHILKLSTFHIHFLDCRDYLNNRENEIGNLTIYPPFLEGRGGGGRRFIIGYLYKFNQ